MAVKHVAAKKKRARKAMARVVGEHHIEIDSAGNATVTDSPDNRTFTHVKFTSNRRDSAIVYTPESPCDQVTAKKPFPIGLSTGPFKCIKKGNFHFDCGHFHDNGQFSPWGDTGGGDTSSGDGGPK